ncbi:MAG: hypothetical protein K9L30_15940 [Desulfobacterales bacterium]|nr:hypothetical protein [Desulfobacterales bacterium]
MLRKIVTIVLVLFFLHAGISSAFAATTIEASEPEDDDDNQAEIAVACIGLVALVGALFMLSKMGDDFAERYFNTVISDKNDEGFSIDFGLDQKDTFNFQEFNNFQNESAKPRFGIKYSW